MKNILLKRIALTNWKAKNIDVPFNEKSTRISARNEVGKSSLQQAWNWVLTSYTTPTSSKNEELFDNKVVLSHDTPEASVKVWIEVDGVEYTIERIAKAKFKRPRGREEYVKDSSDTYTIKVDDIEYTATDFDAWLDNVICPTAHLPFVLDGAFFTTLSIESRMKARAVLESIVGDVTPKKLRKELKEIQSKLDKFTIDQLKSQVSSDIRKTKSQMDTIHVLVQHSKDLISRLSLACITKEQLQKEVSKAKDVVAKNNSADNVESLVVLSKQLALLEFADEERNRIETKDKERKILAFGLAKLEGEKLKIEDYIEAKAEAVAAKINAMLGGCKVMMFDMQKNGEKAPDCILTDSKGVKFATLSNSARLRVNLAVQNMFRKHYGIKTMTWIDEAAVYDSMHLPSPDGQVCYLFAGESETLVVE